MNTNDKSSSPAPNDADRLAVLLKADACIPYIVDSRDKEYPYIALSVYGAPKTNELFIRLSNGEVSFVEAIYSFFIEGVEVASAAVTAAYSAESHHPTINTRLSIDGRGGFLKLDYPPGAMGFENLSLEIVTKPPS